MATSLPMPLETLTLGQALRRGLAQALSHVPAALLLWGARCLEAFTKLSVLALFMAAASSGTLAVLPPGVGALALIWLGSSLVRVLVLGGVLRQGGVSLQGGAAEGISRAALRASGRSLMFWLFEIALDAGVFGVQVLAVASTVLAYGLGLSRHAHAGITSLGLALACVLVPAVGLAAWLLAPVAFVRAVLRDEPVSVAVWASAAWLWRRPWKSAAILGLTALGALVLNVVVSAPRMGHPQPLGELRIVVTGMLLSAAFGAFVQALCDLTRTHALGALELNRMGVRPGAPVILLAEPVIDALPVEPPEGLLH